MDWQAAIERQGVALRMIVAGLVAMVGAGTDPASEAAALAEERPTLARFRHRALLRIVRPAEAAARRLVIALALAVKAIQPAEAAGGSQAALSPEPTLGVKRRARRPHGPHPLRLPLTDPERRLRVRRVAERDLPRITVPGVVEPARPRNIPLPAPHDRLDATCLVLRIRALASALDDMDGEVLRFRRWKARNAAALARSRLADRTRTTPARRRQRFGRISPLRHGRPPGGRRKPTHDVHSILVEAHALAFWALESPDTS